MLSQFNLSGICTTFDAKPITLQNIISMKKLILVSAVLISAIAANAQAQKYLNFGGLGTGVYAGLEFPLGSQVTLGPQLSTDYELEKLVLAAKGNFYFDELFGLSSEWDVYAGANVGWRIDNDNNDNSGGNWGVQIGGRWFWNDKWGLNAEFGGGSGVLGGLGVTMKL